MVSEQLSNSIEGDPLRAGHTVVQFNVRALRYSIVGNRMRKCPVGHLPLLSCGDYTTTLHLGHADLLF